MAFGLGNDTTHTPAAYCSKDKECHTFCKHTFVKSELAGLCISFNLNEDSEIATDKKYRRFDLCELLDYRIK